MLWACVACLKICCAVSRTVSCITGTSIYGVLCAWRGILPSEVARHLLLRLDISDEQMKCDIMESSETLSAMSHFFCSSVYTFILPSDGQKTESPLLWEVRLIILHVQGIPCCSHRRYRAIISRPELLFVRVTSALVVLHQTAQADWGWRWF